MYKRTHYLHEQWFENRVFLLNLLSFEYMFLNVYDSVLWKNGQYDKMTQFKKLVNSYILVEKEDLLDLAINKLSKKSLKNPNHVIYITDECNQSCPYCFEKESGSLKKYSRLLTTDQIDHIVNMIEAVNEYKGIPFGSITLFGGEPLLPKNHLIIQYLFLKMVASKFPKIDIVTNGITLDYFLDILISFESQINSLIVTLNGYRNIHEMIRNSSNFPTYEVIVNNISKVLQFTSTIYVKINILLEKRNLDSISELLGHLKEMGILDDRRIYISFARIQSRTNPDHFDYKWELPYTDYYSELIKRYFDISELTLNMLNGSEVAVLGEIFRHWCKAGIAIPHFNACEAVYPGRYCYYVDGKIYPCTEIAGKIKYAIGDYDAGIMYDCVQKQWKEYNVFELSKCKKCKFVGLCNGGCPVTNAEVNTIMNEAYCLNIETALSKMLETLYYKEFFNE